MQRPCVVLHCHLWPYPLYLLFQHYLTQKKDFQEKVIEHKMRIFLFSTNFLRNISHSKKNSRNILINAHGSSCKVPVILALMLIKLEFSPQIFQNSSYIKFSDSLSSRRQAVPCGRTDGHDEANSHFFSQFCKRA
jgi:hypothetical protein